MIRRLLIANRGAVAVRIAKACREMGVESVAVYSEADAGSAHVAAADRGVALGAAPAADSYLSIPKLIAAARASGADAIHPGYGFLSENDAFAAACEDAGLIFVGPPSRVIATMGSKIVARKMMQEAGVPTVPGVVPEDQSDQGVLRAVEQVGFPALIKASEGGGGKGMRHVRTPESVVESIQAARREAQSAFGDGRLYVERLIERPHHVEIQVLADTHGHVLHLFERECSVQRRHQKVIEESPSPNLTPALRARMTEAAVRAARAASYVNAGTIEFLVDLSAGDPDNAPFYFLEMNTRLQVEHGVTEQVVGVDLVRAQLLVAAGEPLPWTQDTLSQRGHAIEARLYAEDPSHGYLPQAGPLLVYREPTRPGLRIDSGFREGDGISVHYDPLIAKVIATAESRPLAIARLNAALRDFPVLGVRTNTALLLAVLEDPEFRSGNVDTGFLDRDVLRIAEDEDLPLPVQAALDAADENGIAGSSVRSTTVTPGPWDRLPGWRA